MSDLSDLQLALQQLLQRYAPRQLTLAYSGGLDSQLLLHLLVVPCQTLGITLTAVHIHHGISRHADAWAEFCQQQCQKLGVSFKLHRVQLQGHTALEQQARDARYQVLTDYVTARDSALVTAHHANDQLETLLLALKRGAGLAGMAGMAASRPFGKGLLLRPWLNFSRQQLEHVAQGLQLSWVEDESNQSAEFDRNFLRLEVIPKLSERWPALISTSARTSQHLQQALELADYYTERALADCATPDYLDLQQLALQPALQQDLLLRKWLARRGLNPSSQWLITLKEQVIAARADAQPCLTLGPWQLRRYLSRLYLLAPLPTVPENYRPTLLPGHKIRLAVGLGDLSCQEQADESALPAIGNAFQIEFGRLSLPFKPVNQPTKPLKQWFKLWQVPPWQRQRIPLLLQDGQLQVVAGYQSSVAVSAASCWISWQQPG